MVAGAGGVLAETGVADRCEVVPTDFFHSVVPGGDAYVLAQILHTGQTRNAWRSCVSVLTPWNTERGCGSSRRWPE